MLKLRTALALLAATAFVTAGAAAAAAQPSPATAPAKAKPAPAAMSADPAQALERFAVTIQRRSLPNGLRVVLVPEPSSPTVAVAVTYGVGSRHEQPGKSGFAHLFEHMMFEGSEHVKKGEHFELITERGGSLNGTTDADRTNYYEVLPAGELELALWLEADRMRALNVSSENFENQRSVVKEEYRMRYQNVPYMMGALRLGELVFANYAPYANPTIGKMADLDHAEVSWAQDFYQHHYAPNNAVLTIAGNIDADHALDLVERYFGPIPSRSIETLALPATLPEAKAAHEALEDANAKTPAVFYSWLIPPNHTPDHYALELVAMLLGDGDSARLYQELVRNRAVALDAHAFTRDFAGPDAFTVQAVLAERADLPTVERALDVELERVRKKPPSDAELKRLKQRLRAEFVFGLESSLSRAMELGEYELLWGDARGIAHELAHYDAVTAKDMQDAAARYLVDARRVVVEVTPTNKPGTAPNAAPAPKPTPPPSATPAPKSTPAPKATP
jgi:predicted Zn-dependent peptidase